MAVKAQQSDRSKGIVYYLFVAKSDSADAGQFPIYQIELPAVKYSLHSADEHRHAKKSNALKDDPTKMTVKMTLPSFDTLDALVGNYKKHTWHRERLLARTIHGAGGPDIGTLVKNRHTDKPGVVTGIIVQTRLLAMAGTGKQPSSEGNRTQLLLENAGMEHVNGVYQAFSVPGETNVSSYQHAKHGGIVLVKAGEEWVVKDSSSGQDLYCAAAINAFGDEPPIDGWVQTSAGVYPPPRMTLQLASSKPSSVVLQANEAFVAPDALAPFEMYEAVVCYDDMTNKQDLRIQVQYDRRSDELSFGRLIPGMSSGVHGSDRRHANAHASARMCTHPCLEAISSHVL